MWCRLGGACTLAVLMLLLGACDSNGGPATADPADAPVVGGDAAEAPPPRAEGPDPRPVVPRGEDTGTEGSASDSIASPPAGGIDDCVSEGADTRSVARIWNEVALDAIRRDFPAPTVHARNLFHLSAAVWDAWAAYDQVAEGYFVDEKHETDHVRAARDAAISFAAYRVLLHRYSMAVGFEETSADLASTMQALCYDVGYTTAERNGPAALGNRIAATVITSTKDDGSLESERYVDDEYEPVNEPLIVSEPGTTLLDPGRWQPLALDHRVTQNGLSVAADVQTFAGSQWGQVAVFALPNSAGGLALDPGPPPYLDDPVTDADFKRAAVEVIRYSSLLDPAERVTIGIGPGSRGDNALGTQDGVGHQLNPVFGRVIAEFWADGPDSETPPGHWNTLANAVSDTLGPARRIGGDGPDVDRLEWDVKLAFALNGALHDAAVAAWGAKARYDYIRPISIIRYMGGHGQSSDPAGTAFHPHGLPLVPDLVEIVTRQSSVVGERHQHLAAHLGEVAILAWRGPPEDPTRETSGVGWILAVDWLPYQRPTFVTPAFAGYVSGHSAFSRAAAEVLAAFTADEYFPGGMLEWTVEAGNLLHEVGPSREVTLQWGTYADAADEASISRLYGGIHVPADDFQGRIIGATCGKNAWALAVTYFDGSVGG